MRLPRRRLARHRADLPANPLEADGDRARADLRGARGRVHRLQPGLQPERGQPPPVRPSALHVIVSLSLQL